MKRRRCLLLFLAALVLSCGTASQPLESSDPQVVERPAAAVEAPSVTSQDNAAPAQKPPEEEVFDPGSISEEIYAATKADIQALITDLNRIIRARNYEEWIKNLDASYFRLISSADFLSERTEELYRRDQVIAQNMGRDPRMIEKKILRTARDYFINVVVPSRSNDRLDDIDFISVNYVRAYTVDQRGQRLVLYNLELVDGIWKIAD